MGSTTLMTFLVRTPPMTRTVSLLGSWDNFTTPYVMRRDSRIGPEHWSGCHSFANIICDGHGQAAGGPRQGGLKMGGTYWYYYKLDDDIEFHNSAEPSTTQCPLLPGQLVNVLHVPFTLAGNRARNASVSSTGSDVHTLNPADKFLNPRPVPLPTLPRLKTSPSVLQTSWSSYNSPQSASSATPMSVSTVRGRSQPSSATGVRMLKLRRNPSLNQMSRSVSPTQQRGRGFRKAFRTLTSPRSDSPEAAMDRRLPTPIQSTPNAEDFTRVARPLLQPRFEMDNRSASTSRERTPTTARGAGGVSAMATDLALRRAVGQMYGSNDSLGYNSFQGHRRQRTMSRDPSPLRSLPMLEIAKVSDVDDPRFRHQMLLSTVKEISSVQNTPQEAPTASSSAIKDLLESKQVQPDLEKRLPTLPNTPSSAYPVSADSTPSKSESEDIDLLQSHFSCTTIETGSIRNSFDDSDLNRDSDWISAVHISAQPSAYTPSFIEDEPMSPEQGEEFLNLRLLSKDNPTDEEESDGVTTPQAEYYSRSNGVISTISCTTFNSSAPASTTGSPVEHHVPATFWTAPVRSDSLKAPTTWNKFQHYRLPSDGSNSDRVPKNYDAQINVTGLTAVDPHHLAVSEKTAKDAVDPVIPHSTNMRQLLDELSYLGNMIQQN